MSDARTQPVIARRLRPGDLLPPPDIAGGSHVVRDIDPDPDRPNHIIITTNRGQWSCDLDKKFTFPRRDDGSHRNWFHEDVVPKGIDVVPGDTLPPVARPPWEEPYDDQTQFLLDALKLSSYDELPDDQKRRDRKAWMDSGQEVTAVWAPKFPDLTLRVSCYDKVARMTRTYEVHAYEELTFPRPAFQASRSLRPGEKVVLQLFGPYVHKMTGRRFLFAVHPYGRGRWPANIPHPEYRDPDDGEVHVTRPPDFRRDFDLFAFRPNDEIPDVEQWPGLRRERHPKDPSRRLH